MRWLLLLLCCLAGCGAVPQNAVAREPEKLSPAIQATLDPPSHFSFEMVKEEKNLQRWIVVGPDFSLKFRYLKSFRSGPRNLVIIFNILKDKHQNVSGWIASNLTTVGYDCLIVEQEDFLSRRKLRSVLFDPELELADWNTYFSQNLKYVGLIVNHWIPAQPELSGDYSFVGISMGGILSMASAACFPEAQISISVMAGGDNYQVLSESREELVLLNYQKLRSYYQSHFELSQEEADTQLKSDIESLDFSILSMAKCVSTPKIKQIITLYDTSVPTSTQWNLHYALGQPETRTYPTGHISLGIFAWSVRDQIIAWLHEANR